MGALFFLNVFSWEPRHWPSCPSHEKNVCEITRVATDSQTHSLGCQVLLQTGAFHGDSKLSSHPRGMSSFQPANLDLHLVQASGEMGLFCALVLPCHCHTKLN